MTASFCAGRYWEHFKNGHWYQVHDTQTYDSALGSIHLRHVTDTHGWPPLDPGSSVIGFQPAMGSEVTLYQSKRVFQDSSPWVDRVQVDGNEVRWLDGEYRYSLHLERIEPATQPR